MGICQEPCANEFVNDSKKRVPHRDEPRKFEPMTRQQVLLAILAAANGRPFSPAQIQKAAFLVSRNLPNLVDQGPKYNFVPYDYGPFDQAVYADAEAMRADGEVEISPSPLGRWNIYAATDAGIARGAVVASRMDSRSRKYIHGVVDWVRSLSFQQLVKAIYEQYPEMRENSIFKD